MFPKHTSHGFKYFIQRNSFFQGFIFFPIKPFNLNTQNVGFNMNTLYS